MTIRSERVLITTTGGNGVAVGSGRVQFSGKILAIVLFPHALLPSTTDTTIRITKDGDSTVNVETVAFLENIGNAEGITKVYPKTQAVDGANANVPAGDNAFTEFVTVNGIEIDVIQADALTDAVTIEVIYEL